MKKVSVIMPCYNDGEFIREAVASVFAQTYPCIELIIIDDGSEKPTKKILKEISGKTGCILLESEHKGPSEARNIGIREASGTYILPLDADDEILPAYIEKAVQIMEENPDTGAVYCHAELFGEEQGRWNLPEYSFERMLVGNIVFVTALFRKKDWEAVGGFKTNMKHGLEDYDFWLSILEQNKTIYQLPEVLFRYRKKKKSRTTSLTGDKETVRQAYGTIYENHKKFFRKNWYLFIKGIGKRCLDKNFVKQKLSNLPIFSKPFIWHHK